MKFLSSLKITIIFIVIHINFYGQSSYQAPTLSAGLDNVTFKKGTLDVELLAKIISEKQKELIREGIKRIIFDKLGANSEIDFYSQMYMERIVNILFEEKNPQVITKKILEETTNYLFVFGMTEFLLTNSSNNKFKEILDILLIDNNNDTNQIEDLKTKANREQIIYLVYSLLKEVDWIKELGLLNNYNYLEINNNFDSRLKNAKEIISIIKNKNYKGLLIRVIDQQITDKDIFKNLDINLRKNLNFTELQKLIEDQTFTLPNFISKIKISKETIKTKYELYRKDFIDLNNILSTKKEGFFLKSESKKISNTLIKNSTKALDEKRINSILKSKDSIKLNYKIYKFLFFYDKISNLNLTYKKIKKWVNELFNSSDKIKYVLRLTDFGNQELSNIKDFLNISDNKFIPKNYISNKDVVTNKNFISQKKIFELIKNTYGKEYLSNSELKNFINNLSLENISLDNLEYIINDLKKIEIQIKNHNNVISNAKKLGVYLDKKYKSETTIVNSEIPEILKGLENIHTNSKSLISKNNEGLSQIIKSFDYLSTEQPIFLNNLNLNISDLEVLKSFTYLSFSDDIINNRKIKNDKKLQKLIRGFKNTKDFNLNLFKEYYELESPDSDNMYNIDSISKEDIIIGDLATNYKPNIRLKKIFWNNELKDELVAINTLDFSLINSYLVNINKNLDKIEHEIFLHFFKEGLKEPLNEIKEALKKIKYDNTKLTKEQQQKLAQFYKVIFESNTKNTFDSYEIFEKLQKNNLLSELRYIASIDNLITSDKDNLEKILNTLEYSMNKFLSNSLNEIEDTYLNQSKGSDKKFYLALIDFIKFIGNIREMNKAETFSFLLKTMNKYDDLLLKGNNSDLIYTIVNSLRTYSNINYEKNLIEIDAASVLANLSSKHYEQSRWGFYASVGVNQFWVPNGFKSNKTNENGIPIKVNEFNAASEKIGVRYKFMDWESKKIREESLVGNYQRKPYVSNWYGMIYGSGILYKLTDTSSNGYDSVQLGFATGLTFFNALDFNISISIPTEGVPLRDHVIGFSFDIPLSEYLKRL
ncbi:hypothetical protein [Tenacibaculum sp. 190524A05c]|uniref:Uncharacterized protein n=1 Tax=Tenacibaculum platacis TaxID=3137852 RepID=A0ABP1EST3_9FLAO